LETIAAHNPSPEKRENVENSAVWNTRSQTEKSFNLETKIGKLKIVVPLSELAKHDVYRSQISKSLKIFVNEDSVNVFDD